MHSALEVTAAEVETDGHVRRAILKDLVIGADVSVEDRGMVDIHLLHAFDHGLGTEVGEERVVELNIA